MFVKPARAGLIVRDPITLRPLPETGAEVPETSYWLLHMRDGAIVRCNPPAPPAQAVGEGNAA